jgi:hypothetical protein
MVPENETLPASVVEPTSAPYAKAEKAPAAKTSKGPLAIIVTLSTQVEAAVGAAETLGGLSHDSM